MTLDELYTQVTDAISRAEAHAAERHAREAAIAFYEVSRLEERIAELLPASDPEGALARQGVVTAALAAGDVMRALERAQFYLKEQGLSPSFRAELAALLVDAEETLRRLPGGGEPLVVPVHFTLVLRAA